MPDEDVPRYFYERVLTEYDPPTYDSLEIQNNSRVGGRGWAHPLAKNLDESDLKKIKQRLTFEGAIPIQSKSEMAKSLIKALRISTQFTC